MKTLTAIALVLAALYCAMGFASWLGKEHATTELTEASCEADALPCVVDANGNIQLAGYARRYYGGEYE